MILKRPILIIKSQPCCFYLCVNHVKRIKRNLHLSINSEMFNAAPASEVKGFYGQTKPWNYELNKTGESGDEMKWAAWWQDADGGGEWQLRSLISIKLFIRLILSLRAARETGEKERCPFHWGRRLRMEKCHGNRLGADLREWTCI